MSTPSAIDVCRTELFTKVEDLQQKYPQALVDKVVRVREMYNWFLSNPGGTDREFVSEVMQRHSVSKVTAYSDLAVVKTLMPLLASTSRDFHRWRFNEMIMKTYAKAQAKGDTKTMERAETLDIEDVGFEEVDLEEDELFAPYIDENQPSSTD